MDLNKMRKDITEVIDDIKYHSDGLTDLERLPVIQLKVILAKINKLTEKTTILLHYIEKKSKNAPIHFTEESVTELPKETPVVAAEIAEPVIEEIEETDASLTQDEVPEILEKITHDLSAPDLMSAIGINEKYLFTSDLFDGNMDAFKSSIGDFNNMVSLGDANTLLHNLNEKYNWDNENEVTKEFYLLIQRRFESI